MSIDNTTRKNPSLPTHAKVHALIVAAGKGSRFSREQPKQYLTVATDSQPTAKTNKKAEPLTQTILQLSLLKLAYSQYIDSCHLVIAHNDTQAKELEWALPVHVTIGGAERWQSVQAGVTAIHNGGADKNDLVLIHDAARPCVNPRDIDAVIEIADTHLYGAILATPVADTLKQVTEGGSITATIDRKQLWQAQTPQVFRLGYLQEVLTAIAEQGLHITDEASGFEALGYPIQTVLGSRSNIKLTYPDDLPLIQAILQLQLGI